MSLVEADARLAELSILGVVDVTEDGRLALNAAFLEDCIATYEADPSCFDTVLQDRVLARALSLGYALVDVDGLVLAALELGAAEEPDQSA